MKILRSFLHKKICLAGKYGEDLGKAWGRLGEDLGKTWRIGRLGDIGGMRRPGKKKPNHWVKKCNEKWERGAFATTFVKFCEKMTHFYDYSQ